MNITYLGTIKRLRLRTKWDESETHRSITGNPDSQWTLLIDCGKANFIGLKSLNPPTVHYYRQGILSKKMRERLVAIGGVIDQMEGELMVYVHLNKLPELCKIVKAKKKRPAPSQEAINRGRENLLKINKAQAQDKLKAQIEPEK